MASRSSSFKLPFSITLLDALGEFDPLLNVFGNLEAFSILIRSPMVHQVAFSFPKEEPHTQDLKLLRNVIGAIIDNPCILSIKFRFTEYNWDALKELEPMFFTEKFETMRFTSSCHLSNAEYIFNFLATRFQQDHVPRTLWLSKCLALDTYTDKIIAVLSESKTLQRFCPPRFGIITSSSNIHAFGQIPTLQYLKFNQNAFHDKATEELMTGLAVHKTIKVLDFRSPIVNCEALFTHLALLPRLIDFTMKTYTFDINASTHLFDFIKKTENLLSLDLQNCIFADEACPDLLCALSENGSIVTCDLSPTFEIIDDDKEQLIKLIKNTGKLVKLDMSCAYHTLSPQVTTELLDAFEEASVMRHLKFCCALESDNARLNDINEEKSKAVDYEASAKRLIEHQSPSYPAKRIRSQ